MKQTSVIVIFLSLVFAALIAYSEYYTAQPSFCGTSCHIMKKYYVSWQDSKHRNTLCVDCHYAPGEKTTVKAKLKGLSQLFSYLSTSSNNVKTKATIDDKSCAQKDCHPAETYVNKKIAYTEKIPYIHQTHLDKKIEGQQVHCNTCHIHVSEEKHFEVPQTICYLCHFKNQQFNEGRGKCTICHDIPEAPLQKEKKEDQEPITHASLEKNEVSCVSCHYELIVGEGDIKEESCLECHDTKRTVEKLHDKKLMHEKHVAGQEANCFNCHGPIKHKSIQFVDPIIEKCSNCHKDHHSYQKKLLLGEIKVKTEEAAALMFKVKTNCLGCHTELTLDKKGELLVKASAKSCVPCHSEKYEQMVQEWKNKIKKELTFAAELEQEAEDAFKKYKNKVDEETRKKAEEMLAVGKEYLNIVRFGNVVHNQKFSIVLIDNALNNLEDLIDLLKNK